MDRKKKERAPVRSQFTKRRNELVAALEEEAKDDVKIGSLVRNVENLVQQLYEHDNAILQLLLDNDCTDEEYNLEFETVDKYRNEWNTVQAKVDAYNDSKVRRSSPSPSEVSGATNTSNNNKKRSFKLPKIELRKFSGDLKEWLGFWSQFKKIDEDESLHAADKFHYLLQAMTQGTPALDLVETYPASAENYPKAVEALKDRYGNEGLLLQVYVRELLNMVICNATRKEQMSLEKMYTQLDSHLRALQTLSLATADPSTWLFPLIESSLPEDVLRAWQRDPLSRKDGKCEDPPKSSLDFLMEFLKAEVKSEQRISLAKAAFTDSSNNNRKEEGKQGKVKSSKNKDEPTSQSLFTSSSKGCLFCDKSNHVSQECFKAARMTLEERSRKVKDSKSCFSCLKKGHNSKNCKASVKCSVCGRRHYEVLCRDKDNPPQQQNDKPREQQQQQQEQGGSRESRNEGGGADGGWTGLEDKLKKTTITNSNYSSNEGLVLMKTVQVNVVNAHGQKRRVRLLFDEGSNRSYIKTSTAERMECKVVEEFDLQTTLFGGTTTIKKPKKKYEVNLQSNNSTFSGTFHLINEDVICGTCPIIPKGAWMRELSKKKIFVNDTDNSSPEIEILIGSNLWGQLMTGRMCKLENGLIAVESVFGWTISGEMHSSSKASSIASTVITLLTQGEKSLPELWDLEAIGIRDPVDKLSQKDHDEEVRRKFQENITQDSEGRYKIKFPWIDKNIPLPTNKSACEKTLQGLTKKLMKEDLVQTYDKIFQEWEAEGIIESIHDDDNKGHFLPHHRVLKPESKTTPVRPVFNASFKIGNQPSLNDCLERGPNLLELIPTQVLRFREKDVAATAEVRKAFQMISVDDEDKNYQKFLWWEGNPKKIKIYRHNRVVFGMNCSPFILAAVLEWHLDNVPERFKATAGILKASLYVDNTVPSFDSGQEYYKFKEESTEILAKAKMNLCQWESNIEKSEDPITNILGLVWDKYNDTLSCKVPNPFEESPRISKRSVLSISSQVFDPIGFTAPAILQPKIMLQSSWALKMPWDQEWAEEPKKKFLVWLAEISEIRNIKIPRKSIGSFAEDVQLHLFTDASQDAYAAVVYARSRHADGVKVQLLSAKSRLAPLSKRKLQPGEVMQRVTIPRLELLGCFIGARLLQSVKDALKYQDVKTVCWSDSTTALAWIKRGEDWGTFVGNRIKEINLLTHKDQWRHVPGPLNPADLPSRGCSPYELRQSKWWEGPSWLYENESTWPSTKDEPDEALVSQEKRRGEIVNLVVDVKEPRFSYYFKNVRVAAWIRRFLKNCKAVPENRIKTELLTEDEIRGGEVDVLRGIQEVHFPDKKVNNISVIINQDRLACVKTRLDYKEDSESFKYPVLLPSKDPLVIQLIRDVHETNCHAGTQLVLNTLRERYWILQGRRTVNRVIRSCVKCRRFDAKSLECSPAPLPETRIDTKYAFGTTGVDLAGPIYLQGNKKAWVVLYTCAVYRGVHFDIVDSLSSEEFLSSLHKFSCTIGRPDNMISDNGTNFIGAQTLFKAINWKKMEEESQVKRIKWRFNPPTAAWWGGFWERLVRSLKDLLRRMIGKAKLSRKQLESCLAEVSHAINNRPLTTLTENPSDLIPLTPAMFMRDLPISGLPEIEKIQSKDLQEAHRKLIEIKKALRGRYRKEYLGILKQNKMESRTPEPEVGDVVLIGHDNMKRFAWPMGRIMELVPGRDKKIRVAKVKTSRGILERPLQRLYPLEVQDTDLEVSPTVKAVAIRTRQQSEVEVDPPELQQTKSGRRIKTPQRFGHD